MSVAAYERKEYLESPKDVNCPMCRAKKGTPCKRPSGHTVFGGDYHKERKERFEKLKKSQAPFEHIYGAHRLDCFTSIACPACDAPAGIDCDGQRTILDVIHRERKIAFLDKEGVPVAKRNEKPFTHWPDALSYEKWAIMSLKSGKHTYGPRPVKMPTSKRFAVFSTYEQACYWEKKLENNSWWRKMPGHGGCLGVFPYFQKPNGKWAHLEY